MGPIPFQVFGIWSLVAELIIPFLTVSPVLTVMPVLQAQVVYDSTASVQNGDGGGKVV